MPVFEHDTAERLAHEDIVAPMDFDLPSNKGVRWNMTGMARLLKSPAISTIRIVQYQGPIELCLPAIALPNDVILTFRRRAVALITLFEDAIVPKSNRLGKYLPAIPVDDQAPVGFADDNGRRMMRA
jgi:hypothetical protein